MYKIFNILYEQRLLNIDEEKGNSRYNSTDRTSSMLEYKNVAATCRPSVPKRKRSRNYSRTNSEPTISGKLEQFETMSRVSFRQMIIHRRLEMRQNNVKLTNILDNTGLNMKNLVIPNCNINLGQQCTV